jgi:hypothetical protein
MLAVFFTINLEQTECTMTTEISHNETISARIFKFIMLFKGDGGTLFHAILNIIFGLLMLLCFVRFIISMGYEGKRSHTISHQIFGSSSIWCDNNKEVMGFSFFDDKNPNGITISVSSPNPCRITIRNAQDDPTSETSCYETGDGSLECAIETPSPLSIVRVFMTGEDQKEKLALLTKIAFNQKTKRYELYPYQ